MADDLFGWDLTYRSVENDLCKKQDLLLAFTHWFIIKNGFYCIGNGDSKTIKGDEVKGETLAPGWNQNEDYNIRYLHADKLYLLRASITGGDIILNFLRADDLSISSCVFKIDDTVKQLKGNLDATIPNFKNVLSILRKELIEPVFVSATHSAAGTQTTAQVKSPTPSIRRQDPYTPDPTDPLLDPLNVTPRRPPLPISGLDPLWNNPLRDPNAIGRNDLDPFGQGLGGGMLFDPLNPRSDRNSNPLAPGPSCPHGLPRGAVPPGARFDPFGPPGTGRNDRGRRMEPDPDHLPPPGYDDMFIDAEPHNSSFDSLERPRGRGRGAPGNQNPPSGLNNPQM